MAIIAMIVCCHAEQSVVPDGLFVAPFPALAEEASRAQIPLDGIELLATSRGERAGDMVVALVTLSNGNRVQQWLLQLTVVALTPEEKSRPPPPPEVWHTSIGSKITFDGARTAVTLRLVGPVRKDHPRLDHPLADKSARALVPAGFLRLGLDRAAATMLRLDTVSADGEGLNFGISNGPFAANIVARDKPKAEQLGMTSDDERAVVGLVPALFAFFDVVIKTPGLKQIFFEMLDKLSLGWSVLAHGGDMTPTFGFGSKETSIIDTSRWNAPLPPTYDLTIPLALNGKPALTCRFMVTRPDPPLLVSAGVIGMHVKNPHDAQRELVIRMLAAREGQP